MALSDIITATKKFINSDLSKPLNQLLNEVNNNLTYVINNKVDTIQTEATALARYNTLTDRIHLPSLTGEGTVIDTINYNYKLGEAYEDSSTAIERNVSIIVGKFQAIRSGVQTINCTIQTVQVAGSETDCSVSMGYVLSPHQYFYTSLGSNQWLQTNIVHTFYPQRTQSYGLYYKLYMNEGDCLILSANIHTGIRNEVTCTFSGNFQCQVR